MSVQVTVSVPETDYLTAKVSHLEEREGLAPRIIPIAEIGPGHSITVQSSAERKVVVEEVPWIAEDGQTMTPAPEEMPPGEGEDTIGDAI